mmetsp:Transcript_86943/g.246165  ORF Transcript_86943/g.246165 Transcript_86943/m.246165 type:complete len:283 (-) Transcript_86943:565-1413(-)
MANHSPRLVVHGEHQFVVGRARDVDVGCPLVRIRRGHGALVKLSAVLNEDVLDERVPQRDAQGLGRIDHQQLARVKRQCGSEVGPLRPQRNLTKPLRREVRRDGLHHLLLLLDFFHLQLLWVGVVLLGRGVLVLERAGGEQEHAVREGARLEEDVAERHLLRVHGLPAHARKEIGGDALAEAEQGIPDHLRPKDLRPQRPPQRVGEQRKSEDVLVRQALLLGHSLRDLLLYPHCRLRTDALLAQELAQLSQSPRRLLVSELDLHHRRREGAHQRAYEEHAEQ